MMLLTGCDGGTPDVEFDLAACCLFIIAFWIGNAWLVKGGCVLIGPS